MSAVAEAAGLLSIDASRALGERLGDTPALAALRAEAAAVASVRAWPDSYQERPWKYHDVSGLDLAPFRPALDADPGGHGALRSCPVTGEHAAAIAFENASVVFTEPAPDGLTVVPFEGAGPAWRERVERYLGTGVSATANRFTAYHYGFLRGGVLVDVAANAEVKGPVRIIRSYPTADQLATPHTLIVTGANSRVTVIEEFTSTDGAVIALPVVEVFPGPGAEVRYVAIHRWGTATRVYLHQRALAEARDAAFTGTHIALGGRVIKAHLESSLVGRGSSSELFGLCFGAGRQHVDFFTVQDHIGPDTRSDLMFKSALAGRARSVYYGLTRVGLEARNADANQENRNLILSESAKADSDPVLEILTSDIIRASHGATAGPVDQEQLFYLQARGIPAKQAEAMLVRAFLGSVLDRVPDDALRDELGSALDARIAGST
jgi:Fe-S cluster assembly protein SufD